VPITLSFKETTFSTFALVDSGAAGASISTVVADALGISWEEIPVSFGLSVSGKFRTHVVDDIEVAINSHSFIACVNVIEGISPHHCILGQRDLFQKAKISFEAYKKEFEITFRQFN
jgi:hypothetical protein